MARRATRNGRSDLCSEKAALRACRELLPEEACLRLDRAVEAAKRAAAGRTAWRVEGTLREFPKFPPVNLWFDYPVHTVDMSGTLVDLDANADEPPWRKGVRKRQNGAREERRSKEQEFRDAVERCNMGEPPTVSDLVEWYSSTGKNVAPRTVRDWIKRYGFCVDKNTGKVVRSSQMDE